MGKSQKLDGQQEKPHGRERSKDTQFRLALCPVTVCDARLEAGVDGQVTLDGWTSQEHPEAPGVWEEPRTPRRPDARSVGGASSRQRFSVNLNVTKRRRAPTGVTPILTTRKWEFLSQGGLVRTGLSEPGSDGLGLLMDTSSCSNT